jgi:hypothetical protein
LGAGVPEAYAEIQSGDSFSRLDRFVDSNQIYINRVKNFLKIAFQGRQMPSQNFKHGKANKGSEKAH